VESLLISLSIDPKQCPSKGRIINSGYTAPQLWTPIISRNTEDGGDILSETSVLTRATRYKDPEESIMKTIYLIV
jgi:hypothetical protein